MLFDHKDVWIKNSENPMFDVTMGSFDEAEIREIVGLYLLDKLSVLLHKENDGLTVADNANVPKLDKLRTKIITIFKAEGLSITIETNLIETDFLDITFNLHTNKYFPYRKPNNDPLYINIYSNHPSTIKKELPKMINKRLSELSCDKDAFDKAKGIYEKALNDSNFKSTLNFNQEQKERKKRNRKIIWFNPPYNEC